MTNIGNTQVSSLDTTLLDYTEEDVSINFELNPIIKECPPIEEIPVNPLILSAQNAGEALDGNTSLIDLYKSYTRISVTEKYCDPFETSVLFSARTNITAKDASDTLLPTTPADIPELTFTYNVKVIDNATGKIIKTKTGIVDNNNSNVTVVASSDQDEVSEGDPRDLYKLYYLDISDESYYDYGRTYIFTVTNVKVAGSTKVNGFNYTPGKINTSLVTESCEQCLVKHSTGDLIETTVGISTLKRNTEDWLKDSQQNKLGVYLALESSSKGFILPRLTQAQINALGTMETQGVEEGMIVWDTDNKCLKMLSDTNSDNTMEWHCITYKCN